MLAGSVGSNQPPLGASTHFQFFTEFCISACFRAQIKDPQQVHYDKGRDAIVNAPKLGTSIQITEITQVRMSDKSTEDFSLSQKTRTQTELLESRSSQNLY